ncbi:hypothetical protein ACFYZE_19410 [Streptomyces sp. NPDC001796]|uniref:helix-turn-helix domain-containing protein n=1 Tax=Streptomyces sp. NPDC001796 TaxID=3364609 RepID=UPI00367EEDA6
MIASRVTASGKAARGATRSGRPILGIGDWGVNGTDISIGKLAVYSAAAGISLYLAAKVSEIAARRHFSDASHFIRNFKSTYGATPAAYLRAYGNPDGAPVRV